MSGQKDTYAGNKEIRPAAGGGLAGLLNQATPGPWTFDCQPSGARYDGVEYVVPTVEGPETRTLAGKSWVVVHEYESVAPESEAVQNARLVALAPEMAKLLIDTAARFQFVREVYGHLMHVDERATMDALLARFDQLNQKAVA